MDQIVKRKVGRPRLAPEELVSARPIFTIRLRRETRLRLGESADKNGRSLADELETRVEQSFRDDDVRELLKEAMGQYGETGVMVPHG